MKYLSHLLLIIILGLSFTSCDQTSTQNRNADAESHSEKQFKNITSNQLLVLDSILADTAALRELIMLGEFDQFGKHDITFNSLSCLTFDFISSTCNDAIFLRNLSMGVQLDRNSILDLSNRFLYIQFIPCVKIPSSGPSTFYIAYRGVASPREQFDLNAQYYLSGTNYKLNFPTNYSLPSLRADLRKDNYGSLYNTDPSNTVSGNTIGNDALNFNNYRCQIMGASRQINSQIQSTLSSVEILKLIQRQNIGNDGSAGRGIILFFGYDDSSPTNRIRFSLGNLFVDAGNTCRLGYFTDFGDYFLERTWP